MKLLLHTCCAPCAIYPIETLRKDGIEVMGFFYRHNIHPYTECLKRQETLTAFAESIDFKVIFQNATTWKAFCNELFFGNPADVKSVIMIG